MSLIKQLKCIHFFLCKLIHEYTTSCLLLLHGRAHNKPIHPWRAFPSLNKFGICNFGEFKNRRDTNIEFTSIFSWPAKWCQNNLIYISPLFMTSVWFIYSSHRVTFIWFPYLFIFTWVRGETRKNNKKNGFGIRPSSIEWPLVGTVRKCVLIGLKWLTTTLWNMIRSSIQATLVLVYDSIQSRKNQGLTSDSEIAH